MLDILLNAGVDFIQIVLVINRYLFFSIKDAVTAGLDMQFNLLPIVVSPTTLIG